MCLLAATLFLALGEAKALQSGIIDAADAADAWDSKALEVIANIQGGERYRATSAVKSQFSLGLLYSAAGGGEFARREVLPATKYLTQLGVTTPRVLFIERSLFKRELIGEERERLSTFFGDILFFEDHRPPALAGRSMEKVPVRVRAKLVKIISMAASPFDTTIFLDFDARPCVADFAIRLAAEAGSYAVALTNKFNGQANSDRHLDLEHNSACIVLRKCADTQGLLSLWLEAFLRLGNPRDQPALMIAIKKLELPHKDLNAQTFCRNKISAQVSCDAGCLVAHKPQKHDIGQKVFVVSAYGAETLALMLEALKLEPRCDVATRLRLTDEFVSALPFNTDSALRVAEKYRVFWDMPWAADDLYKSLAERFPKAKFVSARASFDWATNVASVINDCTRREPRRLKRFARLYGFETKSTPEAIFGAHEARLDRLSDHFLGTDRYLQIDDLHNASSVWGRLCDFVEAWAPCPVARPLPASASSLPSVPMPWCPRAPLKETIPYHQRVRAHLNRTHRPSTASPPKVQPRPRLSSAQLQSLKRAIEIQDPPRWHASCAPRYPRGVLYNRIPKSGSASVMSWMSAQLNASAKHRFGLAKTNVTWWTPHVAKHRWLTPADEVDFVETIRGFAELGDFVTQRHVYHTPAVRTAHPRGVEFVNVARDPIDRCVSRYNYEAFYKKRIPPVDMNDCINSGRCNFDAWHVERDERHFYQDFPVPTASASEHDRALFMRLSYNQSMMLLMDECHDYMTRWFCGHGPDCRNPNEPDRALTLAKSNILRDYAHVGVLEDLPNTVQLFRLLLPTFFLGDPQRTPDEADFPELHSQKTLAKKDASLPKAAKTKSGPLSVGNLQKIMEANRRDLDLYFFILDLHRRRVRLCLQTNGSALSTAQRAGSDKFPAPSS